MYKAISILFIVVALMAACQEAPQADKAKVTDAQAVQPGAGDTYLADTAASSIGWIGTKPTGKHHGSIRLASGTLHVKDTSITGGHFVINMHTMQDIDLAGDTAMKNKLERELKGPLFFDVEKYPTAIFEITGIKPYHPSVNEEIDLKDATHIIQGNFTMKAVTKNITFPAIISINSGKVSATASFNIDRTLWGISYRADKSVQDKLINSQVNISFNIIARR
ncbi:YceI family protein [Chitinophaga vietnamensis]|uniref:YceI family protein n=1 Tax=Chitinophaga vietnamensis TaxID=2593957 RepID=UPI001177A568|nr:YceI family protein [Chitinophaga vietnamensis]